MGEEIHRAALTAFSHRGPRERNKPLVDVLGAILRNPTRWHPDIPEGIIDLFATDPSPEATYAMLEVLPNILDHDIGLGTTFSVFLPVLEDADDNVPEEKADK